MYKLLRIEVSPRKFKKYVAILRNLNTNRIKQVHFGDSRYQHYKDRTKLKHWKHLDHGDRRRLKRFRQRFKNKAKKKFSAAYFAWKYLW
tara:strand:- start:15 stop:281 length:267 start_codon:yes stop_codon:yes gene_type:complete